MAKKAKTNTDYTRSVLIQIALVLAVLIGVIIWQWEIFKEIYIDNQVNAVGWAINGAILFLFLTGLAQLVIRFSEYRYQESALNRFLANIRKDDDPLGGIEQKCMIAERYVTLAQLNRRRAKINHGALAATLHAEESSRNSYLKFVQSVLVLTGVFGTIVALSISLLGASDFIQGNGDTEGMRKMIYGMSTALSTTMSAIIAYLIFGYFYIKLTDTQTYLISRVEEVTATTLLPHLQSVQDKVTMDYSDSIRGATELMQRFDQSQRMYAESAQQLQNTMAQFNADYRPELTDASIETGRMMLEQLQVITEMQREAAVRSERSMRDVIHLLQEGFRLQDK
ncbi:MAG: MotA/TolQ/ExbB proton channel family protein [Acidiferrobacterales bacterium]|nr:MotA/TolQ/ExbB proton channel family protein [Acidiferrobacterales bacterium]